MADIILRSVGNDKVQVIKILREELELGLKEAKEIADDVEIGIEYTMHDLAPEHAQKLIDRFVQIGAVIKKTPDSDDEKRKTYHPPVNADKVAYLSRQDTMNILQEIQNIAKESEEYDAELVAVSKTLAEGRKEAEKLRSKYSTTASLIVFGGTALVGLVGILMDLLFLGIVFAVVMFFILLQTVGKSDLKKHEEENNANADAYIREHVEPLQERLDEVYALREDLIYGGKRDWAIDVVGKDLFYSACIEDLYNLVKGRRADNLKEALNKYDDTQYKARMEEMQMAVQNAAEISAAEAVKQTAQMKEIEKNTHRTARAARVSASANLGTYRNTIRKKRR